MAALGVRPAIPAALPRSRQGLKGLQEGLGAEGTRERGSKASHNQDSRSWAGPPTD